VAEIVEYLEGERSKRVSGSCSNHASVRKSGEYGYGIGFLNQFVKQFVPRGIVGEGFKNSMLLKEVDLSSLRDNYAEGVFKFYLAPTGFAQAFFEFGYFGCVFFFLFAKISRHLEVKASTGNKPARKTHLLLFCHFHPF